MSDGYYSIFYRLFLLFMLAIPVTAFFLGNGWLCFGLLFFIVSSWIGVFLMPVVLVYSVWVWFHSGFSFSQYSTFFLACSVCGYLLFTLARKRVFVEDNLTDCLSGETPADFDTQIKQSLHDHLN